MEQSGELHPCFPVLLSARPPALSLSRRTNISITPSRSFESNAVKPGFVTDDEGAAEYFPGAKNMKSRPSRCPPCSGTLESRLVARNFFDCPHCGETIRAKR